MTPKQIAISIAAGAGLLLVGAVAWALSQAVAALIAAHATVFGLLALASAVIVLIGGARILLAIGAQQQAKAAAGAIVRLPNNFPVHVLDVPDLAAELASRALDDYYAAERIRAGVSPTLTHYHNEVHAAPAADILGQLLSSGSPAPAIPDGAPQFVAADAWRGWIDRAPHLLIAGRTEAGKTTLATAILIDRALAGDAVLVLDPHYQPGKWAGVPTIGGGNNFDAILRTLPFLVGEMRARFKEFEQGRPTEDFQRLTVLIDEVPAVVSACMETTPSGGQKITDQRWIKFAQRLGSEARKVRISVILLTQSTLVKDIQINSQQRDNYLRIGLGDRVPTLLSEEPNSRRRAQLHELRIGQPHPAAMEWLGEIHMLDTSTVKVLSERAIGPSVQTWTPPALPAAPAKPPTAPLAAPAPAAARAELFPDPPAPIPTDKLPEPTTQEQILMLLDVVPWLTSSEIAQRLAHDDVKVVRVELSTLWRRRSLIRREASAEKSDRYEWALSKPLNQLMAERVALSA